MTSASQNRSTLKRAERLKSRRSIGLLFSEGNSIKQFPLRLIWRLEPTSTHVRATFSVGKSAFKRAISRNRIKRLLRETYRLSKPSLLSSISEASNSMDDDRPLGSKQATFAASAPLHTPGIDLMVIYTGRKMPTFGEIESAMKAILANLSAEINGEDEKEEAPPN